MSRTPHKSTLFPYTTLFRSQGRRKPEDIPELIAKRDRRLLGATVPADGLYLRSEEHTSELQSRGHLVCRLLLEKKNTNSTHTSSCNTYVYLLKHRLHDTIYQ